MVREVGEERTSREPISYSAPRRAFHWLLLTIGFAAAITALYQPALRGPFVSDDFGYLTSPYTQSFDASSLAQMFDPTGDARFYTGNYAPVHLLMHAIERHFFAGTTLGYHMVNVLIHALNSVLLIALLLRSRAPLPAALLGGAFFAAHPANVEAVAWISQLKTNAALAFSLLALLALGRRPALGAACFALALLTKAAAVFALPMAAAFTWVRRDERRGVRRDWLWIAVWVALFGLYALPQFAAFRHIGSVSVPEFSDPATHLRSVAAVGARYLVMASTGLGVSAFQEPPPVQDWLDPWWLAALPAGALLGWRALVSLARRREEAAWWIGAAAAFVPVSQLFPFLIPVADRYLYFILPGLIGGVIGLFAPLGVRRPAPRGALGSANLARSAAVATALLVVAFAASSHQRAKLWRNETLLLVDAATHYPDGGTAHYLRARRAAQQGDADAAVAALRVAAEHGLDRFDSIRLDSAFAPIRSAPAFRTLVSELAGRWIARLPSAGTATQPELLAVARAHRVREEYCEAGRQLERAALRGGPLSELVRSELEALAPKLAAARCPDPLSLEEDRYREEEP